MFSFQRILSENKPEKQKAQNFYHAFNKSLYGEIIHCHEYNSLKYVNSSLVINGNKYIKLYI